MNSFYLIFAGALLGLVLGSFVGMASWRWPRGLSFLPSSRCTTCSRQLGSRDLVPVFSWLIRKGRCGCGQTSVSGRYAMIELAAAAGLAFLLWRYGPTLQFGLLTVLFILLLIIIVIDFEHGIIPDGANLALAVLGVVWIVALEKPVMDHLLSALTSGGIGLFLATAYSKWRGREMLGWGDVKFMAAAGLWLPLESTPLFLAASGVFGLALGLSLNGRAIGREFPFGPALAAGLAASLLLPPAG